MEVWEAWELLISLVVVLIRSVIWGIATAAVIKAKGYEENWFWWGFFFGIFPFIAACAKPDNHVQYEELKSIIRQRPKQSLFADQEYVQEAVAAGGWQCICGRVNLPQVSTCTCGRANLPQVSTCTCGINKRTLRNSPDQRPQVPDRVAARKAATEKMKTYKTLLDAQVITQEQYDEKEKELFGW